MNYEEMSDFEINKLVVELKCKGQLIKILPQKDAFDPMETGVMSSDVHIITSSGMEQSINPCNNPSDAWSIIVENELSLWKVLDEWESSSCNGNIQYSDNNPLRAAMICFLKMKDAGL